jgi:hypothetical protein
MIKTHFGAHIYGEHPKMIPELYIWFYLPKVCGWFYRGPLFLYQLSTSNPARTFDNVANHRAKKLLNRPMLWEEFDFSG